MIEKRKYYLSGPITGHSNYLENFEKYEKRLNRLFGHIPGWSLINPAKVNAAMPPSTSYSEYMTMAETMLNMCVGIILMPRWETSKGAKFEKEYAKIHGMTVYQIREGARGFICLAKEDK